MARRTKEQAVETRQQVLNAAENLFLEKGYDNVSLEEVAVLAGVTRGAVHWHFKNKHGLLLALRHKGQEPFRRLADEFSDNAGAASLEKLSDLISNLLYELERDPRQQGILRGIIRLDIALVDQAEESDSFFYDDMVGIMLRIFEAINRDSGLAPPWTPHMAASMMSATIVGLVVQWSLDQEGLHLSQDGTAFIRMILSAWKV